MHDVDKNAKIIRFIPMTTHGDEKFRAFDFEVM